MNLIDQIRTIEQFAERLSLRLPLPRDVVIACFTDPARIAKWYADGMGRIDGVEKDKIVLMIGDDHRTEWEFVSIDRDQIIIRQRIDNSPPVTACISIGIGESEGTTNVDIVVSGKTSLFWKQKFLQGWQSVENMATKVT